MDEFGGEERRAPAHPSGPATIDASTSSQVGITGTIVLVVGSLVGLVLAAVFGNWILGAMALFVLVVALVGYFRSERWHGRDWQPARLAVSDASLALGQPFAATFQQAAKAGRGAHRAAEASAALICQEWVEYTRGSDTHRKTVERCRIPLDVEDVPPTAEAAVAVSFSGVIPEHLPPSFSLEHNRVDWLIEVTVDAPEGSDPTTRFPLEVVPRRWPHARAGES